MVRENSVCIIHVIFNAATDGDKPVKRRVKYDKLRNSGWPQPCPRTNTFGKAKLSGTNVRS